MQNIKQHRAMGNGQMMGFVQKVKRDHTGRFSSPLFPTDISKISSLVLGVISLVLVFIIGYYVGAKQAQSTKVICPNEVSIEFINEAMQKGWLTRER